MTTQSGKQTFTSLLLPQSCTHWFSPAFLRVQHVVLYGARRATPQTSVGTVVLINTKIDPRRNWTVQTVARARCARFLASATAFGTAVKFAPTAALYLFSKGIGFCTGVNKGVNSLKLPSNARLERNEVEIRPSMVPFSEKSPCNWTGDDCLHWRWSPLN